MNTLGLLETLLLANMITAEEYRERKAVYVDAILELYCRDNKQKEAMTGRDYEAAEKLLDELIADTKADIED